MFTRQRASRASGRNGFAIVEALVIGTIVALIAGVAIIALTATTRPASSRAACRKEAVAFEKAVARFHDEDPKHKWPGGDNNEHVFGLVLHDLVAAKPKPLFSPSGPDMLAGSQRDPRTNDRGWIYDFENHTTYDVGC